MHKDNSRAMAAKSKKRGFQKSVKTIIIGVALFGAGWLVGSGSITFRQFNYASQNNHLPEKLDYSSIDTIYQSLKNNFDGELNETKLIEGLKAGLARATGDPYTEYLNPKAAGEFRSDLDGTFEGIGAQLGKDADNNIIIISPISGYPAERAGLRPKDVIAEINGESAYELTISEAVDRIRGEKGTEVVLGIVSGGSFKEVAIVREQIDIPSVEYEIQDGIGILTISRFGDDTVRLAREAAREFRAGGIQSIILDMRGNPGGYLEGAVDVASLWLDPGTTILTERRDNVITKTYKSTGETPLKGVQTVVLINEGSASASEIVAGALRDNNAATLVGQTSFGKGSVQQPVSLRDGGLLKITIARWFTPEGSNIDKEGIEPDQHVEITADDLAADRDPQFDAARRELNR